MHLVKFMVMIVVAMVTSSGALSAVTEAASGDKTSNGFRRDEKRILRGVTPTAEEGHFSTEERGIFESAKKFLGFTKNANDDIAKLSKSQRAAIAKRKEQDLAKRAKREQIELAKRERKELALAKREREKMMRKDFAKSNLKRATKDKKFRREMLEDWEKKYTVGEVRGKLMYYGQPKQDKANLYKYELVEDFVTMKNPAVIEKLPVEKLPQQKVKINENKNKVSEVDIVSLGRDSELTKKEHAIILQKAKESLAIQPKKSAMKKKVTAT